MQFMRSRYESSHRVNETSITTLDRIHLLRERLDLARLTLRSPEAPLAVPTRIPPLGPSTIPHVLLLDPDAETLGLIGHVLEKQGMRVTRSALLPDAESILRLAPDVIVLAVAIEHVPGAPGRLHPMLRNIPVIHTTSSADRPESPADGPSRTPPNPMTPDALLMTIDTLMVNKARCASSTAGHSTWTSPHVYLPETNRPVSAQSVHIAPPQYHS